MSNITPFVKRMRTVGGTIYVFSSATEDIGLNISERNNVVKMSNYALLNIPDIVAPTTVAQNKFNVMAIPGAFDSFEPANIKDGGVVLAESFQNYALNLEANLINRTEYDPKIATTVSERVFWKWMKETGAVRWVRSIDKPGYWEEELATTGYESVVQNVGEITAGSIRYDGYGSFNETYVLIPSSYGKSKIYFKQVEDVNYKHGLAITNGNGNILGRENYTIPHPDALDYLAYYDVTTDASVVGGYTLWCDSSVGAWWTNNEGIAFAPNSYYTDTNAYVNDIGIALNNTLKYVDGISTLEYKRSKVDCMSLEYDLNKLYGPGVSFDTIATDPAYLSAYSHDQYYFNAILIYYSVYASSTAVSPVSTNLLGVLFLDNATPGTNGTNPVLTNPIVISGTKKIQGGSSIVGSSGFGTSYSFRLNIKTDNMFDDTQMTVYDNSNSTTVLEDFTGVLSALEQSVNTLNKQTSTINYISNQYVGILSSQNNLVNKVDDLQHSMTTFNVGITGVENTIPMFSYGSSLTDTSIYVYGGKFGIKNNQPTYDLDVNGDIRSNNLIINQSIKDSNGVVILGVGSPKFLKEVSLGSSFAWVNGMLTVPSADVSTAMINSRLTTIDASIVILRAFDYDVSLNKASVTYVNNKFIASLKEASLGSTFKWFNGKVDVCTGPVVDTSNFVSYTVYTPSMAAKANLAGNPLFTGDPQRSTDIPITDNSNNFATTKFVRAYVDASTVAKADKSYVDASLNLKASLIYVDGSLNLKSNISDVSTSLSLKSNISYVDGSLNLKSNISYVDASLILRDVSINNLTTIITDLSTKYYSPYMDISTLVIATNSSTYVTVGNILTDRSIIISYTTVRDTIYREGELRILNSGSSLYVSDRQQENTIDNSTNLTGITFSAVYIDNSINLNILNNPSTNSFSTTFKYSKKIIAV